MNGHYPHAMNGHAEDLVAWKPVDRRKVVRDPEMQGRFDDMDRLLRRMEIDAQPYQIEAILRAEDQVDPPQIKQHDRPGLGPCECDDCAARRTIEFIESRPTPEPIEWDDDW